MILKVIGWLITIGIPTLVFMDMFDTTALLFFGVYYGFALFIQTIALGVFMFASGNKDMQSIIKAKLMEEHSKDSALFQYLIVTVLEAFVIAMLWTSAPMIALILGVKILLGLVNIVYIDRLYKLDDKSE